MIYKLLVLKIATQIHIIRNKNVGRICWQNICMSGFQYLRPLSRATIENFICIYLEIFRYLSFIIFEKISRINSVGEDNFARML